ncbi:methylated-DNA--[protein]-cysteine S-methyltransferase [Cohnella sp. REN36]|uniref:methylated-DNA--[protein]-cysteine S-methyltransferase n=1 Tax=Cohnella sp. REN36 TaxID=2887347 RepID=UPI001D1336E8|nr:methylated-DNA--[protein]-cysteine S-methyltransferase [Cohnella sp. REN36]MCC3375456.1 methylated-DNA--[protein]-cysteine S-methyltransferase [Cohnella sp. REN36]
MKHRDDQATPLYWSLFEQGEWKLHLAAATSGLVYVGSPDAPFEEMARTVGKRFPRAVWTRDDERLRPYAAELAAYFGGTSHDFALPHDLGGTPFQRAVWEALCGVPYGETLSYSDIAARIGRPASVRAVGTAIGANPVLIAVPCHRIVGKGGALTGYRGGLAMKTRLLDLERRAAR